MKNADCWKPSKFVQIGGRWVASPDTAEVGRGSRLIVSILGQAYHRVIRTHARGRLLDLGCGKVPLYKMYKDLVTENICVDWESSLHDAKYIDHFVDLNGPLPFDDGLFDTVLTTDVLEHIRQPQVFWHEMSRVLKPGGKLILSVPFLYWLHEEPHDYCRYTAHKLRDFCAEHHFNVLELEPYGGGLEVILDISAKHIARHPWLSALHLHAAKLLLRIPALRALSNDQKRTFPLGYCLVAAKHPELVLENRTGC